MFDKQKDSKKNIFVFILTYIKKYKSIRNSLYLSFLIVKNIPISHSVHKQNC